MLDEYLEKCVPCKQRNLKPIISPLGTRDPPRTAFQHIALDLAGPYIETENGNRYTLTVIDLLTGFLEAHPIPDKSAIVVAKVLVKEIFSRYSWPYYITSDNGLENCNEVLKAITELGHIQYVFSIIGSELDPSPPLLSPGVGQSAKVG